jgi:hypothetical protein
MGDHGCGECECLGVLIHMDHDMAEARFDRLLAKENALLYS